MKNIIAAFTLLLAVNVVLGQAPADWFHMSPDEGFNGVATQNAYRFMKGKPSTTVIVAVLDSGVDVEHEDLADNVWVNLDEIPDNGIDDDQNGYIDDINGWNFIGGPKGNVHQDSYEATRLYKKLKYRYDDANESQLSKDQMEEYAIFKECKETVLGKRETARNRLDNIKDTEMAILGSINALKKALDGKDLTLENLDSLDVNSSTDLMVGERMAREALEQGAQIPTVENLRSLVLEQFQDAKKYFQSQLDFAYNPDFDPRILIGDDYNNPNQLDYGNNDVEGPDASHGTHVSGIIGAVRDNKLGMDGIATDVKIMSVRTVPDGDERDKDVAAAIRYAVDNGASIINMSFGKGYAWDKQIVDEAVQYAYKNDVLLVHAAGNSAQNNDTTNNFPNDTYAKKKLFKPKYAKNWIEVGALSYQKGESLSAPFSNYGKSNVDIFAPGMSIYSTVPNDGYQPMQGTSMASPVVAGVAAMIRSYYPNLSAVQVKQILLDSSVKYTETVKVPGENTKAPFSSLSVSGGVVNAYKALKLASTVKGKKKKSKKNSSTINRA